MIRNFSGQKGFVTIIGILAAAVIICVLYYFNMTKPTPKTDERSQQMIAEAGIDNSSYETTLTSMKRQVKAMEQKQLEHAEHYTDNLYKDVNQ